MKVFKHKTFYQVFAILGTIMFCFSLYLSYIQRSGILAPILFGIYIVLSILFFVNVTSKIIADDRGLTRMYLWGKTKFVEWNSISGIKERPFLQKYDLINADGKKIFHIYFYIENLDQLLNLIEEKVPFLYSRKLKTEFSRKKIYQGLELGAALFFLGIFAYFYYSGERGLSLLFFLGIAFAGMIEYAKTVNKVKITPDFIILKYLFHAKKINVHEIDQIRYDYINGKSGEYDKIVYIYLKNGKKIKLGGFDDGDKVLYKSIKHYIKQK
jgi:hypothetical protein